MYINAFTNQLIQEKDFSNRAEIYIYISKFTVHPMSTRTPSLSQGAKKNTPPPLCESLNLLNDTFHWLEDRSGLLKWWKRKPLHRNVAGMIQFWAIYKKLTKLPFGVTSAEVVVNCPDLYLSTLRFNYFRIKKWFAATKAWYLEDHPSW